MIGGFGMAVSFPCEIDSSCQQCDYSKNNHQPGENCICNRECLDCFVEFFLRVKECSSIRITYIVAKTSCCATEFWPKIQPFRKFPGLVQPFVSEDSFAGSPPRGGIVDEFCGVENFAQTAALSA
jgi:hypothetical protein